MQIDRFNISRRSKYDDHKPGQLCLTVDLVDGENKQTVELDDHVIIAVLEVIRDATTAKCKSQAALVKSSLEAAIAAPALEAMSKVLIED